MKQVVITILLLLGPPLMAAAGSMYTPLSGPACTLVKENKETGSTVHSCPGPTSEIKTLVAYDDQRTSISLVLPEAKQEVPLNLWSVVTRSFSSLGSKAEWRIGGKSKALIVRVNTTDADGKRSSMLAVAKVTAKEACVVAVISAAHTAANVRARESADDSADKPCLSGDQK